MLRRGRVQSSDSQEPVPAGTAEPVNRFLSSVDDAESLLQSLLMISSLMLPIAVTLLSTTFKHEDFLDGDARYVDFCKALFITESTPTPRKY